MKLKKLFPVLVSVALVAAVFVVPVAAQSPEPPNVAAPVFDWNSISQALNTLLSALLLPVVGFAARWLFAQGSYQKSLLDKERQVAFNVFIKTLIYAAEQMKLAGFIDDKLTYVVERAETWLARSGMAMDLHELRARIEATVRENFPKLPAG